MSNLIVNIKTGEPYDLYIGRENKWLGLPCSKWCNPFPMKNESQREEVLTKFKEYLYANDELMDSLEELDGLRLGCYCFPRRCHANILLEALNTHKLLFGFINLIKHD